MNNRKKNKRFFSCIPTAASAIPLKILYEKNERRSRKIRSERRE